MLKFRLAGFFFLKKEKEGKTSAFPIQLHLKIRQWLPEISLGTRPDTCSHALLDELNIEHRENNKGEDIGWKSEELEVIIGPA